MKSTTLRQTIVFPSDSHDVYELLMDLRKHAQLTGNGARISRNVGGAFSVYDGYATGKNIELIDDKKIVQTWRAGDWEKEHYSIIEFKFSRSTRECTLPFVKKNSAGALLRNKTGMERLLLETDEGNAQKWMIFN